MTFPFFLAVFPAAFLIAFLHRGQFSRRGETLTERNSRLWQNLCREEILTGEGAVAGRGRIHVGAVPSPGADFSSTCSPLACRSEVLAGRAASQGKTESLCFFRSARLLFLPGLHPNPRGARRCGLRRAGPRCRTAANRTPRTAVRRAARPSSPDAERAGLRNVRRKRSGAVGRRRPRREARFPNRRRNQQKLGDAKLPHAKKLLLSQNAFQALCGAKRIYFCTQHVGRKGVSDVSVQKL